MLYSPWPTMIGFWPLSNTPDAVSLVGKSCFERCRWSEQHWQVRYRRLRHLDLHDGAGVGAVAGQRRGGAAGVAIVPVAGVVVIARVARREGRRGIVVEDQRLAGELREVDDDVMPLGRGGQQRVLVDVAGVEHRRVVDPGGGVGRDDDRRGQETALGADRDPVRPFGARDRGREDRRVFQGSRHLGGVQRHLGAGDAGGSGAGVGRLFRHRTTDADWQSQPPGTATG